MSDILIRGMEMPCKGTHLLEVWNYGEKVIACGHHKEYKGEPFDLVELPEHGDLISRDQAFQMMLDRGYQKEAAGVILEVPVIVPSNKEETE